MTWRRIPAPEPAGCANVGRGDTGRAAMVHRGRIGLGIYGWVCRRPPRSVVQDDSLRELPLTPLGLSHTELAQELGRYRLLLHALAHALASTAPMNLHNDAFPALEDLGAMLDVDIGARSAPSGQARMSELEREVLMPLLARLQQRLAGLTHSVPSRAWLPALHAADEDIAHAERALAHR
jgi:hypothetical protein